MNKLSEISLSSFTSTKEELILDELNALPYQLELLDKAINKNIIAYLRTGSGKTFIAVMLIKHYSYQIQKEFSKGGKRTIFLANTVPLVQQQADFIRKHTHLNVGEYFGDKRIDDRILDAWDQEIWNRELEKNSILVMSPQILLEMILHSFLDVNRINLIIFDECHHATGNHPFAQIINQLNVKNAFNSIRILGLTASIVHKKCSPQSFNENMRKLEDKFYCKIETASIIFDEDDEKNRTYSLRLLKKPNVSHVSFDSSDKNQNDVNSEIRQLTNFISKLNEAEKLAQKSLEISDNPFKFFKKEIQNLEKVYEELGLYSFKQALTKSLESTQSILKSSDLNSVHQPLVEKIKSSFEKTLTKLDLQLKQSEELDENKNIKENLCEMILKYSSNKVKCLLEIFRSNNQTNKFWSIVFVERKYTASFLNELIQKLSDNSAEWSFLKSDLIFGSTRDNNRESFNSIKQKAVLQKFKDSERNVLIATSILEEGIDLPACNLIVRFNRISNFGSYIQSKGRARSENSSFCVMIDEVEELEYVKDLNSFEAIENSLEKNLLNNKNSDEYDIYLTDDELKRLNQIIEPYRKGTSEITCHSAINLLNRYCSSIDFISSSILYPIYEIEEEELPNQIKIFTCSVRLPPNSVINITIKSAKRQRKKWAKMDAALLMCKELDKAGELADNLTILSREDWLTPHYHLEKDQEDENGKKIGTTKNKREYPLAIANELRGESSNLPNSNYYLFEIKIVERAYDLTKEFRAKLDTNTQIGFLTLQPINEILPEFELYQFNTQFDVSFQCSRKAFMITERQMHTLQQLHKNIFNELLGLKCELDFENSAYGGFVVFLKTSIENEAEIDWEFIDSLDFSNKSLYDLLQEKSDIDVQNRVVKTVINANRLFSLKEVLSTMSPMSEFPKPDKSPNFLNYFLEKYSVETKSVDQPLVELKSLILSANYLTRMSGKPPSNNHLNYKELYISEHVKLLPFKVDYVHNLHILPDIFYRLNCLLKANELKMLINGEIQQTLNIPQINESPLKWKESIKFNRLVNKFEESASNGKIIDTEPMDVDVDDEPENSFCFYKASLDESAKEKCIQAPTLIITENHSSEMQNDKSYNFPNVFQILQCLTLKSACDDFDLERYEILGDCYLKLIAVLKIYIDFYKTNEGKMVSLKSARVSNRNLFELAIKKELNKYIVPKKFNRKDNWLAPYAKGNEETSIVKLSDKSLADCVEALIGVYLVCMGTDAAKAFIQWLEFTISNQMGKANFFDQLTLPDPNLTQQIDQSNVLREKYETFQQETLGYTFNNIFYLYQALTHPSDVINKFTSSYQKLELVGDAVLDFLITQYIYSDVKEHSPGELTELRQSLVNNKFFGQLAVKHSFSNYLEYRCPNIFKKLSEYTELFSTYSLDKLYFENAQMNEELDELDTDPPKFLADIFESVAGAIYLDSNRSLSTVWNVYYKFLQPYLVAFKNNPPKSPIQALYLLKPNSKLKVEYETVEIDTETHILAKLSVNEDLFEGRGISKQKAKLSAFKKAVRKYDTNRTIIFF